MRKGRNGGEKKRGGGNGGKNEKTDENGGHYIIASSWPPERRPLECRTLVPISLFIAEMYIICPIYISYHTKFALKKFLRGAIFK